MNKSLFVVLFLFALAYSERSPCLDSERLAKVCTLEYRPVCAAQQVSKISNAIISKTYANRCAACANPLVMTVSEGSCQRLESERPATCSEQERQNQVCTEEYTPTCGFRSNPRYNGQQQRFNGGNRCSACAQGAEFVINRECSEIEGMYSLNANTRVCNPDDKNGMKACTREYNPVCGWFGVTRMAPRTFSTGCVACTQEGVTHFTPGPCGN